MNSNVVDLDSYRKDITYIEYDGRIGGITIGNIKIEFIEDDVMIDVLDGVTMMNKSDFIHLIIGYLTIEKPDLLQFDED